MLQCWLIIFWRIFLILNYISVTFVKDCTVSIFVNADNKMTFDNISEDIAENIYDKTTSVRSSVPENLKIRMGNKSAIDAVAVRKMMLSSKRQYHVNSSIKQELTSNEINGVMEIVDVKNQANKFSGCDQNLNSSYIAEGSPNVEDKNNESRIIYDLSNCQPLSSDFNSFTTHRKPLHIGGLFELSGPRGENLGRSELTAAKLAVDHVNTENLLPGYELKLLHNDTKCDPGVGMDALYDFIYRQPQIVMVIGSACSEVTKTLAEIVPYWNLILVSFASTSPALSEREKYKTFFRLAPADSSQNIPRAMFITDFGWDTVATLYEIEGDYSLAMDEMGSTFEQNNITIRISTSFRRYDDITANLLSIKKHDARIIIGGYSEKAARHVLCQAYNLGMFGPRYVWILIGDYVERWWEVTNDTTCSKEHLRLAAEGYFTIDSLNSLSEDDVSSVNISVGQFLEDYDVKKGPRPMSPYATSTYDTVWTIALTLKEALEQSNKDMDDLDDILTDFTYQNGENTRHTFFDIMQNLGFLGISGPISFEGPDRKGISVISQNQSEYLPQYDINMFNTIKEKIIATGNATYIIQCLPDRLLKTPTACKASEGQMKRIALYEPDEEKLNFFCRTCQPIVWLGGRAPRDKIIMVARQKKIHYVAYLCVSSVSVGGLVLAGFFLGYNLYHRRLRYIKLSSPKLNNVAVIGCMFVYAGIIVLGYDATTLYESHYPYLCTTRAFLFSAGFSLSFGSMFTKTYRVHQIFTRANRGLIKSKLLRDKQLLFIVGALLIVDSIVLLIWGIVDPMHKRVTNLATEASDNDEDLLYISQLTNCYSEHLDKWTGTLYAYKGLLLVFGVYMAWETRHVKIPALNDSRYIGMNVYNVVIMSVIVVSISNILSHQPTLAYVMESSFMLLSTTITLCLLFVPKIYAIMTFKGEPVIAASGITVDAGNCRRFAVDERRDQFYRAEVQNRVYKREIVELDQEISRLERLLELPVQPYPKLTTELLFLLPESRVDPSPTVARNRQIERERCCSISDAGDRSMGVSEDRSDNDPDDQTSSSKPIRQRSNRLSIRVATNYAYNKLCKLRPRFSVGSVNFRHDYEDLKASPTSPDGLLTPVLPLERSKSSHTLMRQEAVEEKKCVKYMVDSKQSSEKSESRTTDTHVSDDVESPQDYTSVSFEVPVTNVDTEQTAPPTDLTGCDGETDIGHCDPASKRKRKFGNTLDVPSSYEECRISEIETTNVGRSVPKVRRARSIIEHERRTRIRKLQSDLRRIQKELQDLDELEYEVSVV